MYIFVIAVRCFLFKLTRRLDRNVMLNNLSFIIKKESTGKNYKKISKQIRMKTWNGSAQKKIMFKSSCDV